MTINGRIFIVGCPRSGTTLLQSFLAAHPQIRAYPETQFFIALLGFHEMRMMLDISRWKRVNDYLSRFRADVGIAKMLGINARKEARFFLRAIGHPELNCKVSRYSPFIRMLSNEFITILDQLAREKNAVYWSEKSPNHLFSIELMEKYIKDALFIHVIRNGVSTIASLYDMGSKHPDTLWKVFLNIDGNINRWNKSVLVSMRYKDRPNHCIIRYEDLISNPALVLGKLCNFIGVPYSVDMVERRTSIANKIIYNNELHKNQVKEAINTKTNEKFRMIFSKEQQEYIQNHLIDINRDNYSLLNH